MEKQISAIIPFPAPKHTMLKSISPPSRKDTAQSPSPSDKDSQWKSDICRSKHYIRFRRRHQRNGNTKKHLSKPNNSGNSDSFSSDSESYSNQLVPRLPIEKVIVRSKTAARFYARVTTDFALYWTENTSLLANKSSKYEAFVVQSVSKWAEQLQVQIGTNILDSLDPILIISFLSTFKLACHTNGIHKRATVCLLHFFIKKPAAAVLNSCSDLSSKRNRRQKEETLTGYCKVVNYLLDKYATGDLIVKLDAEISIFHSRLIQRQQNVQKLFETRHCSAIFFSMNTYVREYS